MARGQGLSSLAWLALATKRPTAIWVLSWPSYRDEAAVLLGGLVSSLIEGQKTKTASPLSGMQFRNGVFQNLFNVI